MSTQEIPQTEVPALVKAAASIVAVGGPEVVYPSVAPTQEKCVLVSVPLKSVDFVVASLAGSRAVAASNIRDTVLEPYSKVYYIHMYTALDAVLKQLA